MGTEQNDGLGEPTPIQFERDWRMLLSELEVQYDSRALGTLKDILWVIGKQQKTAALRPQVWSTRNEEMEERVKRYYGLRGAEMAWIKDPNQPTVYPVLGFFLRYNRRRRVTPFAKNNISVLEEERWVTDYLWAIAYPDLGLQTYHERVLTNRRGIMLSARTDERTFSHTDRQQWPTAVENYLQDVYNANPAVK